MERLTKRILVPKEEREVVVFTQGKYNDTIPAEMTHDDIRKVLRKLAEYEGLEEQGLLLRLPCKVGDNVYKIVSQRDNFDYRPYKLVTTVVFRLSMLEENGADLTDSDITDSTLTGCMIYIEPGNAKQNVEDYIRNKM